MHYLQKKIKNNVFASSLTTADFKLDDFGIGSWQIMYRNLTNRPKNTANQQELFFLIETSVKKFDINHGVQGWAPAYLYENMCGRGNILVIISIIPLFSVYFQMPPEFTANSQSISFFLS